MEVKLRGSVYKKYQLPTHEAKEWQGLFFKSVKNDNFVKKTTILSYQA